MGVQPGDATLPSHDVPGFATLVKAFLLEMRARPLHLWPESMVSCAATLLRAHRPLLAVVVAVLLARGGSAAHLRPSLAVLTHLDAVLHAAAGAGGAADAAALPHSFSAAPLLRHLQPDLPPHRRT